MHDHRPEDAFYMLKSRLYPGNLAFFYTKNSNWSPKLNKGITRIVESGIYNKWYEDIMSSALVQEVRLSIHDNITVLLLTNPPLT